MNFQKALDALKQGHKVTRKAWNNPKSVVSIVNGKADVSPVKNFLDKKVIESSKIGVNISIDVHDIDGISARYFDEGPAGSVTTFPHFNLFTGQGNIVWTPNAVNLLAEDWEVVY